MKYYTRVDNTEYEVEINGENILLNGEPVNVDLMRSGAAELYSVLFGGRSYEMLVNSDRFNYTINVRGVQFQVQVEDERARRMNRARRLPTLPDGELAITAPIPGLVVRVLVAEGDAIEEGQPVVLLEAMKMENELRAMRGGIVKNVLVTAGQRVDQNAPLIVLE
ncbi:MAG: biotin/lipoyl-containing protein [Caldilineaceae bacterium]